MPSLRVPALCAVLATAASAQSTWIVDAAGGAGSQFTEVGSAITAAAPGDRILVRPGAYSAFTLDKGVAVLGAPEFSVAGFPATTIRDIPPGETAVVADATFDAFLLGSLFVQNCAGAVHLHGITFSPQAPYVVGLDVAGSSDVTLTEGTFLQGVPGDGFSPAVSVSSADLTLANCTIEGRDGAQVLAGFGSVWVPPGAGITATNSTLHLSRCDVRGGSPELPALSVDGSTVVITGLATHVVRAGTGSSTAFAIQSTNSTVDLDPNVEVLAGGGGPALGGTGYTLRPVVSMEAVGGVLGESIRAEASSREDDIVVVLLGLPFAPTASSIGTLRVNLATAVPLAQRVQPASGATSVEVSLPNAAVLRGLLLGLQSANWDHVTQRIELSNVARVVLR